MVKVCKFTGKTDEVFSLVAIFGFMVVITWEKSVSN
jgi:hypothetical protein